jgi:hypothetical protein
MIRGVFVTNFAMSPEESHSLIPYKLASVSNQYVPATGVPVGALVVLLGAAIAQGRIPLSKKV